MLCAPYSNAFSASCGGGQRTEREKMARSPHLNALNTLDDQRELREALNPRNIVPCIRMPVKLRSIRI